MDRSSRQKINKETLAFNDTLDKIDLTDIQNSPFNASSSQGHMEYSLEQRILGNKTSLYEFKKTGIMSRIFSYNDNMKVEINYNKKLENAQIYKVMLLNNQEVQTN